MKKAILTLFVMTALFASCTTEKELMDTTETMEAQFDLKVESIPMTRAISDGSGATQLMYGVFKDDGELIFKKEVIDNVTALLTDEGYSMSVPLAKGQSYKIVFWAQNPECKAYTISDDMQLEVDYEGINNDESRDAFYCVKSFKAEANKTVEVVLKRPFAQVNVGIYQFEKEWVTDHGMDIAQSAARINGVPNKLDMLTGEASGSVDIEYSLSEIPEETLNVDVDEDGNSESYYYLSMSYLLASEEETSHKMSFTFADAKGESPSYFSEGLDKITVQRNWRTNIVGQILTGSIRFNIKIDPFYEGEVINSGGLYYNFSENTNIEDMDFAFNTNEAATFSSENNNLLTFKDVTFSGKVQYIAFGDYIKKDGQVVVPFTNVLENVVAKDMTVTHSKGITNVEPIDYMVPLIFLRGKSTINNCTFTGTKKRADLPLYKDYWGDEHEVLPYDCGVPNDGEAEFNNCTISRMYVWSHVEITLLNTKVDYIRCSAHNQTKKDSHLTIGSGCEIKKIFVSSSGLAKRIKDENGKTHWDPNNMWSPSLIIKSGAKVDVLDMNGRSRRDANGNLDVIIEEGATVGQIINEGE